MQGLIRAGTFDELAFGAVGPQFSYFCETFFQALAHRHRNSAPLVYQFHDGAISPQIIQLLACTVDGAWGAVSVGGFPDVISEGGSWGTVFEGGFWGTVFEGGVLGAASEGVFLCAGSDRTDHCTIRAKVSPWGCKIRFLAPPHQYITEYIRKREA